jgi:hypothetical protein
MADKISEAPLNQWVAGDGVLQADRIRVGVARTQDTEADVPTDITVYLARELMKGVDLSLVARLPLDQAEATYLALGECIKAVREKRLPDVPLPL